MSRILVGVKRVVDYAVKVRRGEEVLKKTFEPPVSLKSDLVFVLIKTSLLDKGEA